MIRHDASQMNPADWAAYATEMFTLLLERVHAGIDATARTNEILATFPG